MSQKHNVEYGEEKHLTDDSCGRVYHSFPRRRRHQSGVIREESVIDGVNGSDADTEGAKKCFET